MAGFKSYISQQNLRINEEIALDLSESNHLLRSLRAPIGAEVLLFNNKDQAWLSQITQATKNQALVTIKSPHPLPEPKAHLVLAQAIPKAKGMEAIIQKAIEIGVSSIFPLFTDHVEMKLTAEREEKRLEKWHLTAIEAAKQSGNLHLPFISQPLSLKNFLETSDSSALRLTASLKNDAIPLKSAYNASKNIICLVGPE